MRFYLGWHPSTLIYKLPAHSGPREKMKEQMKIKAVTVALSPRACCTRCPRPEKMRKQMAINVATAALSPRTCSIRCPVPKKCSRKLQSMPQRSYCHRERAPYDAPPEKRSSKWLVEHYSLLDEVQCYRVILELRGASVNLSKVRQIHENAWHFWS